MDTFERLLRKYYGPLERFVKFRMNGTEEADDLLQEVCMTAYEKFHTLRDIEKFKPWILQIAQNKCRDYYRENRPEQVSLETVEPYLTASRWGPVEAVRETLEDMAEKDRLILEMTYFAEMSQAEIAEKLCIPVGTVKSRMYAAKERFRARYPYPPHAKGEFMMKQMPKMMPEYTITLSGEAPFQVKWEELQGWMIVPKLGEKLSWGLYDRETGKRTEYTDMEVLGKAEVHGIEGVEILAVQYDCENYLRTERETRMERRFIAQLTDTHCRYLAESHTENGIRKCYTFLDGDEFLKNWGYGPDNCGNETKLQAKGTLKREGDVVTGTGTLDVVGRYTVTIGGKAYDTICVMDVNCFEDEIVSEAYLDQNGRTILWRRFNWDDWAIGHFKIPWTERLPENQRITVNGKTYVHWYDCITDYIL